MRYPDHASQLNPDYRPPRANISMPPPVHQLLTPRRNPETSELQWPEVAMVQPMCVLCRRPATEADRHTVFGETAYAHTMCINDGFRKQGVRPKRKSTRTMSKDMASKSYRLPVDKRPFSERATPQQKAVVDAWLRVFSK